MQVQCGQGFGVSLLYMQQLIQHRSKANTAEIFKRISKTWAIQSEAIQKNSYTLLGKKKRKLTIDHCVFVLSICIFM